MMKHSSHQFGNQFSGFGRQSEKFSHIGACNRHNFSPCITTCRTALKTSCDTGAVCSTG